MQRLVLVLLTSPLRLEKTIELPDVQGRIDHMSVDVKSERLFVSAFANNTVEVIDLKVGKRVHTILACKSLLSPIAAASGWETKD